MREFAERRIERREDFAADCAGNLGEALWDMGQLNDEVGARGVDAVLADLRVGVRLSREGEAGWIERLMRPLDREAHCLRKWHPPDSPGFLLQQMRNRYLEMGEEDGRASAEDVLAERGLCYLRERFRSGRESESLIRTLEGHANAVTAVAVTADGRLAVSASFDKTLKVWGLGNGLLVSTLEGHTNVVEGVAVANNDRLIISASRDRTVTPAAHHLSDLHALNALESLADGTVPLHRWLTNARDLTASQRESAVFQRALDTLAPAAPAPTPASAIRWPAKLPGADLKELVEALLSAFPTRDAFARLLRFELDRRLDEIAAPTNLHDTVFAVVTAAEVQGWVPQLFEAAVREVPGNAALRAIADKRRG